MSIDLAATLMQCFLTNLAFCELNCTNTKGNRRSVSLTILHADQKSNANQSSSVPELVLRLNVIIETIVKMSDCDHEVNFYVIGVSGIFVLDCKKYNISSFPQV